MFSQIKQFFMKQLAMAEGQPTMHPDAPVQPPVVAPPTASPPATVGPVSTATPPDATIVSGSPAPSGTIDKLKQVGPTISVVNTSTCLTDAQLKDAVAAIQIQLDRDFGPAWKTTATLQFVPKGVNVPPGTWVLYVMDTTDQAGALGYHDLTPEGNPLGKVFAKDDITYGLSWSVTISHEILEMLADPYIQNCAFAQTSNTGGVLYALEVADACEDDSFGYKINNVLVSDFVYPTWFEDFRAPGSTKFDHMHVINAPLTLAKGGYIGVFPIPNTSGWTQRLADKVPTRLMLRDKADAARATRRNAARLSP